MPQLNTLKVSPTARAALNPRIFKDSEGSNHVSQKFIGKYAKSTKRGGGSMPHSNRPSNASATALPPHILAKSGGANNYNSQGVKSGRDIHQSAKRLMKRNSSLDPSITNAA